MARGNDIDGTPARPVTFSLIQPLMGTFAIFPLITQRRTVAGSMIGGIKETQEMLDFCSSYNIVSDVEVIRMKDINEAYERMLKGDVRYRVVIDMATLTGAQLIGVGRRHAGVYTNSAEWEALSQALGSTSTRLVSTRTRITFFLASAQAAVTRSGSGITTRGIRRRGPGGRGASARRR